MTSISKNLSCLRSISNQSGCLHAASYLGQHLQCLECVDHLQVGCRTQVRSKAGCHTSIPPMLPDALGHTIALPYLPPIHFTSIIHPCLSLPSLRLRKGLVLATIIRSVWALNQKATVVVILGSR